LQSARYKADGANKIQTPWQMIVHVHVPSKSYLLTQIGSCLVLLLVHVEVQVEVQMEDV
jgi:hypothetical protein